MRGLKQVDMQGYNEDMRVAPFTGAWIETLVSCFNCGELIVAPFTGAWIETSKEARQNKKLFRRTLHGCVD